MYKYIVDCVLLWIVYGQCMNSMAADFTGEWWIFFLLQYLKETLLAWYYSRSTYTDTSHTISITLPLTPHQPEDRAVHHLNCRAFQWRSNYGELFAPWDAALIDIR